MREETKEFYRPYFLLNDVSFSSPKTNKILFRKRNMGFILLFVISIMLFIGNALFFIIKFGFKNNLGLAFLIFSIITIIIFIIWIPVTNHLWYKNFNKDVVSDTELLIKFQKFKDEFNNLNKANLTIDNLTNNKFILRWFKWEQWHWGRKIKNASRKKDDSYVVEIFLEYLYEFYYMQKNPEFKRVIVLNSENYNIFTGLVFNNFFTKLAN